MNEASNCVAFSRQGAVSTGTHAVAPHVGLDFAAGTYSPWPAKDRTCQAHPLSLALGEQFLGKEIPMTATRSPSIDPMRFRERSRPASDRRCGRLCEWARWSACGHDCGFVRFGVVGPSPRVLHACQVLAVLAGAEASGGDFCVSILSAPQEGVCRAIAARSTDKFEGVSWRKSPSRHPHHRRVRRIR